MQLVADFAAYAKTVVAALADKVVYWTTFNEPQSICLLGFGYGGNAPGIDSSLHLGMPVCPCRRVQMIQCSVMVQVLAGCCWAHRAKLLLCH